jgi:hypothetical protein
VLNLADQSIRQLSRQNNHSSWRQIYSKSSNTPE